MTVEIMGRENQQKPLLTALDGGLNDLDPSTPIDLSRRADFALGRIKVRPSLSEVVVDDQTIRIQPRVMQVLVALHRAHGEVISREALLDSCWGGLALDDGVINRCIGRLRRLSETEAPGAFTIETLARIGYRLTPIVDEVSEVLPVATPKMWRRSRLIWLAPLLAAGVGVAATTVVLSSGRGEERPQIRIADFTLVDPSLPAATSTALHEELLAAFRQDDALSVVTDRKAPVKGGDRPFLLSGSVRDQGLKVRFTVHLTDQISGDDLWSHQIDRPKDALVKAPQQVAALVSMSVRCGLYGLAGYRGQAPATAISASFKYCDDSKGGPRSALPDDIHRMIAAAPGMAAGWSALALNDAERAKSPAPGSDPAALRRDGEQAAARALQLDPRSSQAYLAMAELTPHSAYAAREKLLVKAIAARPTDCGCEHQSYGQFLRETGRVAEALSQYQLASNTQRVGFAERFNVAQTLYQLGRPDEAEREASILDELHPGRDAGGILALLTVGQTRRYDRARSALRRQSNFSLAFTSAVNAVLDALQSGDARAKANAVKGLLDPAVNRPEGGALVVGLLEALDQPDAALATVQKILPVVPQATELTFGSGFGPVRSRPEYLKLVETTGLLSYWRASKQQPDFCRQPGAPTFCRR